MDEEETGKIKRLTVKYEEHLETENYTLNAIKSYRSHLIRFLKFLAGESDVADLHAVTRETLHRYQMHLHQDRPKGKPLAITTQHRCLVCVRAFFRYLAKTQIILGDPSSAMELPRLPETLPRTVMTAKQVDKILNAPDVDTSLGLRDKAIMELLYSTGIRNAELRNLDMGDVDAANNQVVIHQGKGRRDRVVPLGEVAGAYVAQYIREARGRLTKGTPTAALFVNHRGVRLGECGLIYNIVGKYAAREKLPARVTPHVFRHTCATHMLRGRANIRHIQELLGHRSLETTQRYTRLEIIDLKKEHRRCHPRERTK
jgi:integrase/recombinase XerD